MAQLQCQGTGSGEPVTDTVHGGEKSRIFEVVVALAKRYRTYYVGYAVRNEVANVDGLTLVCLQNTS